MKKFIKTILIITLFIFIYANIRGNLLDFRSKLITPKQIEEEYDSYFSPITVDSDNFLLARLDDFSVLAGKNTKKKAYPASLTKIMTVLISLEQTDDLNKELVINPDIFQELQLQNAALAGFKPGETTTIKDLLYSAILPSGAEACISLATSICPSEKDFVQLMNDKARDLKMRNTHFTNTVGLHDDNHYTNTEDLTKLLVYALANKDFYEIFTSDFYSVDRASYHDDRLYMESTLFKAIRNNGLREDLILGGKTGYTEKAGLCLASLGEIKGEKYILISLNAKGKPSNSHQHIIDSLRIYENIEKNKS